MKPVLIICSEFNINITNSLLGACENTLRSKYDMSIDIAWVPGAFEIPTVASQALDSQKYSGIICLGAIIRGESAHFDFVASCCADRISELGVKYKTPIIFGVLTTLNLHQAMERSGLGSKGENHGIYYAEAMIKTLEALAKVGL